MSNTKISVAKLREVTFKLLDYCRANDWAGYDPYDALNSEIFKSLPLLNFRLPRLVLTQTLKRSPLNFRPLLLVPKTQNPKAIALFLQSFLKLSRLRLLGQEDLVGVMAERLVAMRSPNIPYWSWGYSFPWQTRTILVPRGAPNLVCTSFVANALFDACETNSESRYLNMAVSAAEYILDELYWTDGSSVASFSYPIPSLQSRTHNANFLGAAFLCRAYKNSGETKFLEPALKVVRYSAGKQHDDGSWDYGEHGTQGWIDNFHTGYNLCALRAVSQYLQTWEFEPNLQRGFEFYRNNFFTEEGAPRYFHNRTYPIDIHSVAQSIITLMTFKDIDESNVELAHALFKWTMTNMWDEKGYFYYQEFPFFTSKIPYMRWSQAWMLLALSTLLEELDQGEKGIC